MIESINIKYSPKAIPTSQVSPIAHLVFLIFGLPFMAIGAWMIAPYFELIEIDMNKIHVPLSVFAVLAFAFSLPRVSIFLTGLVNIFKYKRLSQYQSQYQSSPWKWDFNWNPQGYRISATKSIVSNILVLLFLTSFLSPFIYFLKEDSDIPFFVPILLCLVVIIIFIIVFYNIIKSLKYSNVTCLYKTFPFKIPGKVQIEILGLPPSDKVRKLKLELQFLESKVISSGSGSNRKSQTIYMEIHKSTSTLAPHLTQHGRVHANLEIPKNRNLTTDLTKPNLRFWELRVRADVPGVDYDFGFLIPIYK
jgi:hypothetical protein